MIRDHITQITNVIKFKKDEGYIPIVTNQDLRFLKLQNL